MTENTSEKSDLKSRKQIREDINQEPKHSGNTAAQVGLNNDLLRNLTHQEQRLEIEMERLRQSLDSYTKWSRRLTIAIILLTAILVGIEIWNVLF